jgi:protein TonB
LRNPNPTYPEAARVAKLQGVVRLMINVDASGHVTSVRVTQSSGFAILDERARSTVAERWVFKAATSSGVPVPSEVVVPIRFTLEH